MMIEEGLFGGVVTIGDLRSIGKKREDSPPSDGFSSTLKKPRKKRQIKWSTNNHYMCIREGSKIMANMDEINELFEPTEDLFFIYKNTRLCASRDNDVPLYEAVYMCKDGTLVRVQKKHLKAAYAQANKKDVKKAWDMDEQGILPYWVDRFVYSKIKK